MSFWNLLIKNFANPAFDAIIGFLSVTWPLLVFLILWPAFKSIWLFWRNADFTKSVSWTFLEIKIPRALEKSPQAMENVYFAIHNLKTDPSTPGEKWFKGQYAVPYTFEMVSFGGEIHFYMRVPKNQRHIIEAAFFSYYPDIEISEVDDYASKIPASIMEAQAQSFGIGGGEIILAKEAAYPIKSYKEFESPAEEKQFDPIASFLEFLSKIPRGGILGVQLLAAPADDKWFKEWEDLVTKLKENKAKTVTPDGKAGFSFKSPGETKVLEAVELNLAKPAFDLVIRYLYTAPTAEFSESFARKGLQGALKQFHSNDMNSFLMNWGIVTLVSPWFSPYVSTKIRNVYKKNRLISNYLNREVPPRTNLGKLATSYLWNFNNKSKTSRLNIESLATIFHMPTYNVLTAPSVKRVESKKSGPPAGMAIFGEEKDIEKFQ